MRKNLYSLFLFQWIRWPNFFFDILFIVVYPFYKMTHQDRAWGRVKRLLKETSLDTKTTPRAVFYSLYKNAIFSYRFLLGHKKTIQNVIYENENLIQDLVKNNTPIVAMSIHQGPFEILHRSLCRYHHKVFLLTNPFPSSALTEALKKIRSHAHLEELSPDHTGEVLKKLIREKGILAMLVDQAKSAKGNLVSLWHKDYNLFLRLPIKANQMGAAIITFRTFSIKDQVIVRFEKIYSPKTEENIITEGFSKEMEFWIEEHPEQWTWNYHKNFKVDDYGV